MARPRKFEEADVLDAARQRFTETGFHGTSVDELSRATGLSKGSLYGAFGDKHALFQRVFDDYCVGASASIAALIDGPEEEALDRLREWLLSTLSIDRYGCLLAKGTAELASENEEVAARSHATHDSLLDSCHQLVEQAQRAGLVEPTADAEALGGVILATHRGLEALAKAGVEPAMRSRIADAVVDSISLAGTRR
jgi:TetR/AcrR family transcriptional repressor of nem operon